MAKESWWKRQGAGRQFLIIFGGTILFFLLLAVVVFQMASTETPVNSTPIVKKNVTEAEYVVLVKNATSSAVASSALVSMTATEYRQGIISQSEAVSSIDRYHQDIFYAGDIIDGVNPPEKYKGFHESLSHELLSLSNEVYFIRNDIALGWKDDIIEHLKSLAEAEEDVENSGNSIM